MMVNRRGLSAHAHRKAYQAIVDEAAIFCRLKEVLRCRSRLGFALSQTYDAAIFELFPGGLPLRQGKRSGGARKLQQQTDEDGCKRHDHRQA